VTKRQQPPPKRRSLRVTGLVDLAGKFKPDDPGLFKLSFLYYAGKRVEFEPVPEGERRTLAQNRFWHKVMVPLWLDYWQKKEAEEIAAETGQPASEVVVEISDAKAHHKAVAYMLGRHTSRGLTVDEFEYLIEHSKVFLSQRGYTIPERQQPLPEDPSPQMPESLT
jgi:hypothetical protein